MSSSDLVKKEEKKAKKNKVMGWVNGLSSLVGVDKFVDIYVELERRADEEDFLRVLRFFINEDNEVDKKFYNVSGLEYANIILSSCIDDMDSDKEIYYKNLLLNIVGKEYTEKNKKSFACLLKRLTESDIKLAQCYYILASHDIMSFENKEKQVNSISDFFGDKFLKLHQRTLVRYGLLKENRLRGGEETYVIENLLCEICDLIFKIEELEPKVLDLKEKIKCDVVINHQDISVEWGDSFKSELLSKLEIEGFNAHLVNNENKFNYTPEYEIILSEKEFAFLNPAERSYNLKLQKYPCDEKPLYYNSSAFFEVEYPKLVSVLSGNLSSRVHE
ncbi:hypothetical protein [Providencia sp. PROV223]|uniref:hypothetical protein n=1 Tax=Providencia sp. PROV223 TaxID=2949917 RepID=UPI00234B633C|nr:hypothetical protein [Providencia sp. PROV223]